MIEVRIVVRTRLHDRERYRGWPCTLRPFQAGPANPMNILGINAYHGDASAALFVEGQLVAAVEEERFTRIKHDTLPPPLDPLLPGRRPGSDPRTSTISRCPANPKANLGKRVAPRDQGPGRPPGRHPAGRQPPQDPEREADPGRRARRPGRRPEGQAALRGASPGAHRQQLLRLAVRPRGGAVDRRLRRHDQRDVGHRRGRPSSKILGEVAFPHSLGVYYTAVTQFLGFPKYGDEYKVMGLASYGEPTYLDEFRRIVRSVGPGVRPRTWTTSGTTSTARR